MKANWKEINLEMEEPSIEQALKKLRLELMMLRRLGIHKVRVVHGVGAIGDGTSIRNAVRAELRDMARDEKILAFCPGELFGPFEKEGKHISDVDHSFREDENWAKRNDNITMVAL